MELRQLKYFICIAEQESMTKAAETLYIAQPALSMQMRNLEEELGVSLLIRHSRGVQLTEAGQVFLDKAVRITREIEAAKKLASTEKAAAAAPIRLGVNPSIEGDFVADILKAANETLPDTAITVLEGSSDQLSEWLAASTIDMGIVYFVPDGVKGVVLERLFRDELVLVSQQGLPRPTVTLEEVAAVPLMLQPKAHKLRATVEQAAASMGLSIEVPFEIRSVNMILDLVERGFGSSVLPAGAVRRAVTEGRVRTSTIVEPELGLELSLAYPEFKQQSRSEILFRRLLRQIGLRYAPRQPAFTR